MNNVFDIPEPDAIKITPVFFLVDTSGSMTTHVKENGVLTDDTRIGLVNRNMKHMLEVLGQASTDSSELDVCVITFGTDAECIMNLCAAEQAPWQDLQANGQTNLAAALRLAKSMIDDRSKMPKRSSYPHIVLISDGHPFPETQHWQDELRNFTETGTTHKCNRYALGIGEGTDEDMLKQFISGSPEMFLRHANDATEIIEFFEYISRVTITASQTGGRPDPAAKSLQGKQQTRTAFTSIAKKPTQAPKRNPFM